MKKTAKAVSRFLSFFTPTLMWKRNLRITAYHISSCHCVVMNDIITQKWKVERKENYYEYLERRVCTFVRKFGWTRIFEGYL